jgi:hypothetical protein
MFRSRVVAARLALGVLVLGSLAACGSGDERDPAAFCTRLRTVQPALTDSSDPAALLQLYRDLGPHAPLQIKDDWQHLTDLIGLATSYDPTDSVATQDVLKETLRAQASVTAVAVWARDTCNIQLGPIPTTVPLGGTGDHLLTDTPPDGTDPAGRATTTTTSTTVGQPTDSTST